MAIPVLSAQQIALLLDAFERDNGGPQAHANVWKRRSYAPMHIFTKPLDSVREAVARQYPEYAIAFDVVFESAGGPTDWHCDYESLGPFAVRDRMAAVRGAHFMSLHFNLTQGGGSLMTLPWVRLSYLHYLCIIRFGIFSRLHRLLNVLSAPLFSLFARTHPNQPGWGNAFDNTRLHAVAAGSPRVSYVLRLVRKGCVFLDSTSVSEGIARSDACAAFEPLLAHVSGSVEAATLPWAKIFSHSPGDE